MSLKNTKLKSQDQKNSISLCAFTCYRAGGGMLARRREKSLELIRCLAEDSKEEVMANKVRNS